MTRYCEIRPEGQLIYRRWRTPDDDEGEGLWAEANHTEVAFRHLYTPCVLADGVTLRDVFLLLNANLELFDRIIGNWCKEIVTEGLSPLGERKPSDLHYLELYWHLTVDREWDHNKVAETGRMQISGYGFPSFHGIGDPWSDSDGTEPMPYGIDFCPANTIAHLPLRLRDEFIVVDEVEQHQQIMSGEKDFSKCTTKYESSVYTLGHILQGIIWEMSFYGGPSERNEFNEELSRRVEAIESGEEKTYSWEEVMERLEERKKEITEE